MPIPFTPKPGALLRYDYGMHASPQPPEMVKVRPVVVIAQRSHGLCVVVPLSTVEPQPAYPHHVQIDHAGFPPTLHAPCWAKCDMLGAVAYWRLDRFHVKGPGGKRSYRDFRVTAADLAAILEGVRSALGL